MRIHKNPKKQHNRKRIQVKWQQKLENKIKHNKRKQKLNKKANHSKKAATMLNNHHHKRRNQHKMIVNQSQNSKKHTHRNKPTMNKIHKLTNSPIKHNLKPNNKTPNHNHSKSSTQRNHPKILKPNNHQPQLNRTHKTPTKSIPLPYS